MAKRNSGKWLAGGLRRRKLGRRQVQIDLIAGPRHGAPVDQRVSAHQAQPRRQVEADVDPQLRNHRELVALVLAAVRGLGQEPARRSHRGLRRFRGYVAAVDRNPRTGVAQSDFQQESQVPAVAVPVGVESQVGPLELVQGAEAVREGERGIHGDRSLGIDERLELVDAQVVAQPQVAIAGEKIEMGVAAAVPGLPQEGLGPLEVGRGGNVHIAGLCPGIGDESGVGGAGLRIEERPGEHGETVVVGLKICRVVAQPEVLGFHPQAMIAGQPVIQRDAAAAAGRVVQVRVAEENRPCPARRERPPGFEFACWDRWLPAPGHNFPCPTITATRPGPPGDWQTAASKIPAPSTGSGNGGGLGRRRHPLQRTAHPRAVPRQPLAAWQRQVAWGSSAVRGRAPAPRPPAALQRQSVRGPRRFGVGQLHVVAVLHLLVQVWSLLLTAARSEFVLSQVPKCEGPGAPPFSERTHSGLLRVRAVPGPQMQGTWGTPVQ